MKSIFNLKFFIKTIDYKSYQKFLLLNFFYLINAILQMMFILSLFFFFKSLNTDQNIFDDEKIKFIFDFFELENSIKYFFLLFLFFGITSNLSSIITNYLKVSFSTNFLTKTRSFFFKRYSDQNYYNFYLKPSSEYLNKIITLSERVCTVFLDSINNIFLNFFLILFIIVPAFLINPSITGFCLVSVLVIFVTISSFFKKKIKLLGKNINQYSQSRINLINILFKNFSEIKINLAKKFYQKTFDQNEFRSNEINKILSVLSHSLKPVVEIGLIIFVFISTLIIFSNTFKIENIENILILTLVTLYRLIPSVNVIYQSSNELIFNYPAFKNLMIEMKKINKKNFILKKNENIKFKQNTLIDEIKLNKINFSIKNKKIIKNFSVKFKKGNIYGISGESGSGKTTLFNILIGLYKQTSGEIIVNNKKSYIYHQENWFNSVSYVAQETNLIRASIYQNIAFNLDDKKIDKEKINIIIKSLKLDRRFNNLEELFISASGGEVQRLSIARSLYKDSKIIILDEPSSSLDRLNFELFFKILNKIKKDRIIILASHDKDILKKCNSIIKINKI